MMGERRCQPGRLLAKSIDAEAAKRARWRRHGMLVLAEQDPRLGWPEPELIRTLGLKLYGERPEAGR